MKKYHSIVIHGYINKEYEKEKDKVNECIDVVNKYNKNNMTYQDMTYLELYHDIYHDKNVIGVSAKIIKPTGKDAFNILKKLKRDMFLIFGKRLNILVRADNEKML